MLLVVTLLGRHCSAGFFASQPGKSFFRYFFRCCVEKRDFDRICFVLQNFLVSTKLSHGRRDGGGGQQLRPDAAKRFLKKSNLIGVRFLSQAEKKFSSLSVLKEGKRRKVTNGLSVSSRNTEKSLQLKFSSMFFSKVQFLKNGWTGSTFALLMPKGD